MYFFTPTQHIPRSSPRWTSGGPLSGITGPVVNKFIYRSSGTAFDLRIALIGVFLSKAVLVTVWSFEVCGFYRCVSQGS